MMKKQLLLAAFLPMIASADDSGTCGDNLTWTYVEATHTLTISGEGGIPYYRYPSIAPWYSYRSDITKAIIEDGVTSIGDGAFGGCYGLTSITIPNSVTSIGDGAFGVCSGLTSITIPNSVTSIGDEAFTGCSGLTSITIPNSVTSIGDYAFYFCGSLASITIPNSVTCIGVGAFSDCNGLASITIPNSVTSIEDGAFYNCSGLTSITIPNSVTSIEDGAFQNCSGLTSITIPNSVTNIGSNAFCNCGLTSISIPNSVTSIGNHAFLGCSDLTSANTGNSVTSIGVGAFLGCRGLTSVNIGNSVTNIGSNAFCDCGLTSIIIPNSVTSIGGDAFQGCGNLSNIILLATTPPTISGSIGNVPIYVPFGCLNDYKSATGWNNMSSCLHETPAEQNGIYYNTFNDNSVYVGKALDGSSYKGSIVIPESIEYEGKSYGVTSLGSAFRNSAELTSIIIPNSVTSISDNAFQNCTGLTSVTIPNSVTSIGDYSFSGCSGLASITIPSSVTSIGYHAFAGCSDLATIIIGTGVETIGEYAFYDCSGLTSITIGNSVTSIENYAFYRCSSLKSLTFNCKQIENWFPYDVKKNITELVIGDNVEAIGSSAFAGCSGLTSVTIPNGVTSIGGSAFAYCSSLTSITIPNSVSSIESSAFEDCSGLTSITIPNNVTSIGYSVFAACSSLISIIIPNSVTSIGSSAFTGCSGLTSITIPSSVTSIGGSAFSGCDNITTVFSEITEPFNCGNSSIFSTNTYRKGTLYIPAGTKDLYTRFDGWREFLKIEEVGGEPEIFNLAFVVDNKELSAQNVEAGTAITPPTKDGDGNTITWYTYPSTMPAHDLVVYGMVVKPTPEPAPTKYTLTYMLDGQQYKQESIEEGATVAKETEPSKEGYTFGGWQNEPTTMPGRNVTVNGSFTINSYRLSFIAENKELLAKNLQYGSAITAPTADGDGNAITWYTYPSTMPAHDLVVYGMVVKQAEPEVFVWLTLKDGQGTTKMRVKHGSEQVLSITPEEGWKLLTVTMDGQDVTAQVKNGGTLTTPAIMQDATITVVYEQEVPSEVSAARQSQANIKVVDDGVVISNAEADTRCTVYASSGQQVVNTVLDGGTRKITLPKGQVYVLTLGARTLKFAL